MTTASAWRYSGRHRYVRLTPGELRREQAAEVKAWRGLALGWLTRDQHEARRETESDLLASPEMLAHLAKRGGGTWCGGAGRPTVSDSAVTCERCREEVTRRRARADASVLRKLGRRTASLREVEREARWRLTDAGLARVEGSRLEITNEGRRRLEEVR